MRLTGNGNVQVFLDTLEKTKTLKQTDWNIAAYYDEEAMNMLQKEHQEAQGQCNVVVSGDDSFRAARKLSEQGVMDVLVLNFANSISQGGGVRLGASAQEEDLCRTSTLYQSLISEEAYPFYDHNRRRNLNEKGSDTAVYSPNVYIIKDEKYQDITPVKVSVVTMAAPIKSCVANAVEILDQRIYKLLCLAEQLGHKTLVLGAWGCGAFGNDPEDVAELFRKNLERFDSFEKVVFAVRMVKGRDEKNYRVFHRVMEEIENNDNKSQINGGNIMEKFNYEEFDYEKALQEVQDSIKKPNILLCGGTGVGKSSLVNSIFNLSVSDMNSATVGTGSRPETIGVHRFTDDDSTVNLYDSEGYEVGKVDDSKKNRYHEQVISYIDKLKKDHPEDMESHIHEVWYCISAANKRFMEIDEKLIKEIQSKKVPIMILITKIDVVGEDELNQLIGSVRDTFPDIHIYTYSTAIDESNDAYEQYVQKDEIIKWALENLDESLRLGLLPAIKGSLKQKRNMVIKECVVPAVAAAVAAVLGVSWVPVPFKDSVPLMAIQVTMTMKILKVFGIEEKVGNVAEKIVGGVGISYLGKTIASQLISVIPILGSAVTAVINTTVAGSVTAILGVGITLMCEKYLAACVNNNGAENLPFADFFTKEKLQETMEYVKNHTEEFDIDGIVKNVLDNKIKK